MAQRIKSRRRKAVKKQAVHYFDYSLLAIIIFLICFGLVMLYSISSYEAWIPSSSLLHIWKTYDNPGEKPTSSQQYFQVR